MAIIIKADDTRIAVEPKNGKDFSLEEMQEMVGGYIEICETHDPEFILVINEDGKMQGLPINAGATGMYKYAFTKQGQLVDVIVGDVLYCKASEVN